ncbi:MAG: putative thymidylate kinase [Candidatus Micrarchaeota archaeon]|nr:MAG: putative thymidylate kinase [Candidatus Micrarchaeota archaeon]
MFVVIEGLDGAGKTTQVNRLRDALKDRFSVKIEKEPTDQLIGIIIQGLLRSRNVKNDLFLQLLFMADRAYHKDDIEALRKDNLVIMDRYFYSTIAYGYSKGMSYEWLVNANSVFPKPDICIILDVAPKEALRRLNKEGSQDYFERLDTLNKVKSAFDMIINDRDRFPEVIAIDGNKSADEVTKDIINIIYKHINK